MCKLLCKNFKQQNQNNKILFSIICVLSQKIWEICTPLQPIKLLNFYELVMRWLYNNVRRTTEKKQTLEKYPYSELFWCVLSRIWTEYREILRISPYLGQKKKILVSGNAGDEKNLHPGSCNFFLNLFSGDIIFSSLVSFSFFFCILVFFSFFSVFSWN